MSTTIAVGEDDEGGLRVVLGITACAVAGVARTESTLAMTASGECLSRTTGGAMAPLSLRVLVTSGPTTSVVLGGVMSRAPTEESGRADRSLSRELLPELSSPLSEK